MADRELLLWQAESSSSGRKRALLVRLFFHFHSLNSISDASAIAVMPCQLFLDSYVCMELAWLHLSFWSKFCLQNIFLQFS